MLGSQDKSSEMILVRDVHNMENFVKVLGCKVGTLPTTYLGLPLGAPYKSSRVWEMVEQRFEKSDGQIGKIQRDFLWGRGDLVKKPHLGTWCTKEMRWRFGVGLWKAIRNGWEFFTDKTSLQVSSRNRVKFWNDRWYGETSLRDAFLGLYAITSSKDAWVVDV
ncbi:hypothetical protein AAG906_021531 [Vitis piasezkii]